MRPSSVAGGVPLRYSKRMPRHEFDASNRLRRALTPQTTRSRITYDVGMLSFLISSPYRPCTSTTVWRAFAVESRV
jgi:hypothetical protein